MPPYLLPCPTGISCTVLWMVERLGLTSQLRLLGLRSVGMEPPYPVVVVLPLRFLIWLVIVVIQLERLIMY